MRSTSTPAKNRLSCNHNKAPQSARQRKNRIEELSEKLDEDTKNYIECCIVEREINITEAFKEADGCLSLQMNELKDHCMKLEKMIQDGNDGLRNDLTDKVRKIRGPYEDHKDVPSMYKLSCDFGNEMKAMKAEVEVLRGKLDTVIQRADVMEDLNKYTKENALLQRRIEELESEREKLIKYVGAIVCKIRESQHLGEAALNY